MPRDNVLFNLIALRMVSAQKIKSVSHYFHLVFCSSVSGLGAQRAHSF